MLNSVLDPKDISTLQYLVTHVFSPLRLPGGDDHSVKNDRSLATAVTSVAELYAPHAAETNMTRWHVISRMLNNLRTVVQYHSLDGSEITSQLASMNSGDVLTFMIRAQNAAVVFRKQRDVTIFESFELSPRTEDVMTTKGKLVCSYPGPAIEIPNVTFDDEDFLSQLSNFLVHMNKDILPDAAPTTRKAQSTVIETRDTAHPRYITELLTGILRSIGRPADVIRISKRVGDDVVWNNSKLPWRRSPLWLLIRVVLQTTLDRTSLGRVAYKKFMLFFMCHIANERLCERLSNDLLQFMAAKISRRLRKLGTFVPDWLSTIAVETCVSLRSMLERRWMQVQASQALSPPWNPFGLNLSQDIQLSLRNSGDYIRGRLAKDNIGSTAPKFNPRHHRRGCLDDFLSSDGVFEEAYRAEPHVTLYDVERAVEEEIDGWVDRVTNNDEACVSLEILANKYSSSASQTYGENPELLSIMLLTVVELWIALDKIATREIPMLGEYSPEIQTSLLEDLLLSKAASLRRLRIAHQYLSRRHSQSHHGSVFSNTATPNTFAVRYFKESPHLQPLKSRIENAAQHEVREKISELNEANARHSELQTQAARAEHKYYTDWYGNECHDRYCRKCALEREHKQMQIEIHEWPLPAHEHRAEVVVFELDCPVSFNAWRTATFHLLVDLCSSSLERNEPYITLDKYRALSPYLVQHPRSRITLASNAKPFVVSHYRTSTSIPTTKDSICVPNGLIFYGYDSRAHVAVSDALDCFNVSKYSTYQPKSDGPYQELQKYVNTTSHTSNDVMANQADCHQDLSLHEFVAFGHVRCGSSLQWLNILRELRGRSLTFRRPEVHLLIAKTVSQVGPLSSSGEWIWHQEIQQPSFCVAILEELEALLRDVEANWLEATTMDTISFLLRRLLASNPSPTVSLKVLDLLDAVRDKAFKWVEELSDKLTKTPEDDELRGFLRDGAAICRSTFDVDPSQISNLLISAQDINIFILCAILIHDHTPSDVSSLPAYSQLLLDRDRRLSLALESFVSELIQLDPDDAGIDSAISRVWAGYRPGSKWTPFQSPNSRWFSCETLEDSQDVYFNLLNGSLLVDGKPLGRLPTEITQHPIYKLIFGNRVLDVIPTNIGMDYTTRGMISGHQVYFSLRNSSDLVIRAKRKQDQIMELIPQAQLEGDLPAVLIAGYAHWLNLSTSIIEIRPLGSIWETSSENWRIDCTPGVYRMQKGTEILVDIRSRSWAMVSELLEPLDMPSNLLISVSSHNTDHLSPPLQLSVHLPRYGLSFYVDDDGDLQSRDIRGMVYDENQCIGTLFGLVNRLVLRPKKQDVGVDELIPRQVLIPEGKVSFQKVDHHTRIKINTQRPALGRVTYQTYKVDTDLGCLVTVGLRNRLYCVYLHALTSGCGIDPLTRRLGTEEALSLLRSASCWSAMKLCCCDVELLGLIASICPARTWYPAHLTCMQKVEWHDLPTNTQHHELYVVANAIKEHYQILQSFHENQMVDLFQDFPSRENHLLERSALRAAYLFSSEFSGKTPNADRCDVRYQARDVIDSGEHRAYTAATTVDHKSPSATITKDILRLFESWSDSVAGEADLSLQYSRSWLAPKLPLIWLELYNLLRGNDGGKWFHLLFSLPAMSYASPNLSDLVPVFVAFASDPQFHWEHPPSYDSYTISDGYHPSRDTLCHYVSEAAHSFSESSPESSEPSRHNESLYDLRQRQRRMYDSRLDSDAESTVDHLLGAWPCETPPRCSLNHRLYDVSSFTTQAQAHFSTRYHNLMLKEHLTRVQGILGRTHISSPPTRQYTFEPSTQSTPLPNPWMVEVDQLFRPEPSFRPHNQVLRYTMHKVAHTSPPNCGRLNQLIVTAKKNATNEFQRQYVSALRNSAECFESEKFPVSHIAEARLPDPKTLAAHYTVCRENYNEGFLQLQLQLEPRSPSERALQQSGQWPRITPTALLRFLASNSPLKLSDDWERCLVEFALLALELQRARRLLRLHLDNHYEELRRELQNEGCDGWNAQTHPDWLLVQLQGNFFIRRVQAEVAYEMISPRSGANTAMQLNMGEGKSSVIVPVVVADLANGEQLVRVVVPKALTAQMFHLLVDRLGGLTNRRIYFLPFSRSVKVDRQKAIALRKLMEECMKKRGILVVQPEHVLSLRLLSVEKQLPEEREMDAQIGLPLLELQRWLRSRSRDILDESDEILHVRYQLVYTIGNQQAMEGSPERWTTTQQILSLVNKHASFLHKLYPLGVEYEHNCPGAFPHFRILHADAGQKLISYILQDILDDRLSHFSFGQLHSNLRNAIQTFVSCETIPPETVQLVKRYSQESTLWSGLLLLRGLLASGILLFAFRERRWRVDYGLTLKRTMLAVPYRAKDVPAQRAEFGHPDVAIILTCLSYYYGGLNEEQLRVVFDILLQQDDPSMDYDLWVRECPTVPETLRTLNGINMKSSEQWRTDLFRLFSKNKATVDFYLSRVVFPREAKEFPWKLSCSGWDLAEKRKRLVTGFSGTNDGQYLLPLHITQRDPDHQRGTNAKVLSYLLQSENNHYLCMNHENGERRSTQEFLRILVSQTPEIRVLLDVGAQMLELENRQLAKAWLDMKLDASAAIYFSEEDELTVLTRDGRTQLLQSSPFGQQLDQCVVYLDDAHTRGTDIKFPIGFRAAVTLGPKVTKDRLAQGCMRMRKLGHDHSLMFFAPLEIDQRIRSLANRDSKENIDIMDILNWAIRETCDDIRQRAPHWVLQGTDHSSRYLAWSEFCKNQITPEALADKWLQREAKSLENLYSPHITSNSSLDVPPNIRQRCEDLGIHSQRNASMDEEQEREVLHEAERERQLERPPRVPAARHSIHQDVTTFARTGIVPLNSKAFRPAFDTLDTTSVAVREAHVWSSCVLVTRDFERTVGSSKNASDYLRPVQWIVSGQRDGKEVLVVVSPYEANQLLTVIRSSRSTHLHLYTPRVLRSMKPCDDLTLYSIPSVPTGWTAPSLLMDQLNVFAGQLYLKDLKTYMRLCRFLCVYTRDLEGEGGIEVECDGFIPPKNRPAHRLQVAHSFERSPLPVVKELIGIRRKGMQYSLTHMGKLLDRLLLSEDDFQDGDNNASRRQLVLG